MVKGKFFENTFSDDVGKMLTLEPVDRNSFNPMSPDTASDGVLEKRWKIINEKRVLVKGSTGPYHQEPLNEKIANILIASVGVNHVTYDIEWNGSKPYSLCETFINVNTELVHAGQMALLESYSYDDCPYEHFIKVCENQNIEDIQQRLNEMMVLDFIIDNRDRHFKNFGLIRNVETLKWKGFAPIYDSGTSLWCGDLIPGKKLDWHSTTFNKKTNADQLNLITDFSWVRSTSTSRIFFDRAGT